ncbi:MAG: Hsp70 family protein [Oscillospiraceae bacterium]|nr:Hsp70 family protein [Oscillospiraceae bacterium]
MKLGIDFGTSFSFVAEWRDENNAPQSRTRENIPTIFYYDEIHGEKIGKEAEQLMLKIPSNGVRNIKKYIIEKDLNHIFRLGRYKKIEGDYFIIGRLKEFTLREIVAKFIKMLIDTVLADKNYYYPHTAGFGGAEDIIENIAVAIPVELNIEQSWTFLQKCVAEAAGIPENKVYFIHEPVAAAMSYYVLNKNAGNRILIYDLGGGTVDAAVVAYGADSYGSDYGVTVDGEEEFDDESGRYEVLAMYGERIGGNDFDEALGEYILDNTGLPEERAYLRVNIKERSAYGEGFKKEVTEAKEKLSQRDSVSFAYERISGKIDITTGKFEALTDDLLERTVFVTKQALRAYKEKYRQNASLDAIVLSGGSSQMPMVRRRLERVCGEISGEFPSVKLYSERPDCAISFGAAIYAANLDRVTFVAPYTYGVYFIGRGNFDMIYKNEPMAKHPDGKYISAKKIHEFDTSLARDLKAKVYEYSLSSAVSPNIFKPAMDIYVPTYALGGRLGAHELAVELRLFQGRPIEARIFDNSQDGKEISIEKFPAFEDIKKEMENPIKISKDDSRREIPETVQNKNGNGGLLNLIRRIWRKLFSGK